MREFVFDECVNSQSLIEGCNSEAKCRAYRYPEQFKEKEDTEMLPELLAGSIPLVTTDAVIVQQHSRYIPEDNAGIIIVRLRRPSIPMNHRMAGRLIRNFKARFPLWADTNWSGLLLEICEQEVFISSIPDIHSQKISVSYSSASFERELISAIELHANAGAPSLEGSPAQRLLPGPNKDYDK